MEGGSHRPSLLRMLALLHIYLITIMVVVVLIQMLASPKDAGAYLSARTWLGIVAHPLFLGLYVTTISALLCVFFVKKRRADKEG